MRVCHHTRAYCASCRKAIRQGKPYVLRCGRAFHPGCAKGKA